MKPKTTFLTALFLLFLFGHSFAQKPDLPGDANCDGDINVLDVISSANYFIGLNPDPFCFENADMNGDGLIDILDMIAIVHLIADDSADTVVDIDGNVYQTVIIGDQEWMAENLRVSKYNNGDVIPSGFDNVGWIGLTEGAFAIYPHDEIDGLGSEEEVVSAYGKLYNWYAVDDSRGLCPVGWSVASDDDWAQLVNYLIDQGFTNEWNNPEGTGNALKSCRQVNSPFGGDCDTSEHPRWNSSDWNGFDEYGFSAYPSGYRISNGSFTSVGIFNFWWSSTMYSDLGAWYRSVSIYNANVNRGSSSSSYGLSVRCVRD